MSRLRLGAGVIVPIPWSFTIYSNVFWTVWGENIEEGTFVSVGLLWDFGTPLARSEGWGDDW